MAAKHVKALYKNFPKVTPSASSLCQFIVLHCDENGVLRCDLSMIIKILPLSCATIYNAVNELERKGLVLRKKAVSKNSNKSSFTVIVWCG